jgi:23S rRNA pseudouridine955/2504/2580 synthase
MAYENPDAEHTKSDATRGGSGVQYVEAGEGDAGQRLDNFLIRVLKGVPRTHVYRLLRKGEVRVNSKRAKPDQRLVAGDRVRLPPIRRPEAPADGPRPASASLQKLLTDAIVYEDADLLVVNKPAGVAVHGGSGMSHGVIEALRRAAISVP